MTTETDHVALSMAELRAVTGFSAACAQEVLTVSEGAEPSDARPREVVATAWTFADGGPRGKALRVTAMAAHRAARETAAPAAAEAARSAGHAAAAA